MKAVISQPTQGKIGKKKWFQFLLPILTKVISGQTSKKNLNNAKIILKDLLDFFKSLKIARVLT